MHLVQYVMRFALSRVRTSNDLRLLPHASLGSAFDPAVQYGYLTKLRPDRYTEAFYRGYVRHATEPYYYWDADAALAAAS